MCTVVDRDKASEGLLASGDDQVEPFVMRLCGRRGQVLEYLSRCTQGRSLVTGWCGENRVGNVLRGKIA
jgi:hypothetical protein